MNNYDKSELSRSEKKILLKLGTARKALTSPEIGAGPTPLSLEKKGLLHYYDGYRKGYYSLTDQGKKVLRQLDPDKYEML